MTERDSDRGLRGLVVVGVAFSVVVGAPAVAEADALATVLAAIALPTAAVVYGGWLSRGQPHE